MSAAVPLNEAAVRRIVRDELRRAELAKKRVHLFDRNRRSALKLLQPTVDLEQARRQQSQEFQDLIVQLASVGSDSVDEFEGCAAGLHRGGQLVDGGSHCVEGVLPVHESSPSSVGSTPTVGGGVASGDELRAHTPGADTEGGAE